MFPAVRPYPSRWAVVISQKLGTKNAGAFFDVSAEHERVYINLKYFDYFGKYAGLGLTKVPILYIMESIRNKQ